MYSDFVTFDAIQHCVRVSALRRSPYCHGGWSVPADSSLISLDSSLNFYSASRRVFHIHRLLSSLPPSPSTHPPCSIASHLHPRLYASIQSSVTIGAALPPIDRSFDWQVASRTHCKPSSVSIASGKANERTKGRCRPPNNATPSRYLLPISRSLDTVHRP